MFVRLALSHLTSRPIALFALFSAALPSPQVKRVDYLITPWGRYAQKKLISPTHFDMCALFVTRITSELRDTGHRRLNKQIHLNRTSL